MSPFSMFRDIIVWQNIFEAWFKIKILAKTDIQYWKTGNWGDTRNCGKMNSGQLFIEHEAWVVNSDNAEHPLSPLLPFLHFHFNCLEIIVITLTLGDTTPPMWYYSSDRWTFEWYILISKPLTEPPARKSWRKINVSFLFVRWICSIYYVIHNIFETF